MIDHLGGPWHKLINEEIINYETPRQYALIVWHFRETVDQKKGEHPSKYPQYSLLGFL
jgi:hypothetical protein